MAIRVVALSLLIYSGITYGLAQTSTPPVRPNGTFTGVLKLSPVGDGKNMKVLEPISYRDVDGHEIDVPADFETDGASIPRALWTLVGSPFSGGNYVEAAVIHDEGCVSHQYTWQITHRMFYTAMLDSGVSPHYARLLYYGVRVGGPRWEFKEVPSRRGVHSRKPIIRVVELNAKPISKAKLRAFDRELSVREAKGTPISPEEIDARTDQQPE